jgi:hypothetical protein
MTHTYCKAYYSKDLKQFSAWSAQHEESAPEYSDDEVVYLWDDFTVVKSPVLPGGIIFDQVTPEWQDFCKTMLQFKIPDDLLYAYEGDAQKEPLYG